MAHPKRKISKTRRDKRRTHDALTIPNVVTCKSTGTNHLFHKAYYVEGNLYFKGKMIVEAKTGDSKK